MKFPCISWGSMANGKHHDNLLTDLIVYGEHPFPPDIERLLRRIDELGRRDGRWPLGENWPFSGREFDWERGNDLDAARRDLAQLITFLEQGRGDEVLVDPLTQTPLANRAP
jgi:hypothetical protein